MRYLEGISLAALARGNRRMLAPLKARHAAATAGHDDVIAALRERRAMARQIKDPEKRAAALEALKGEQRPVHPTLVAIGCTVVGAVVGWPLLHGLHTVVLASAATTWVVAAFALGYEAPAAQERSTATDSADQAEEESPEDGHGHAEEQLPERPLLSSPTPAEAHALTLSLTARGRSVLLTRLAADLAPPHRGWKPSTKAVRDLLSQTGIPVREGVRTPDGNGPGVHHEDVPALPSSGGAPAGRVVANVGAVQSANANANNGAEWTTREGFVLQPDPDNPARTIVVGRADAA